MTAPCKREIRLAGQYDAAAPEVQPPEFSLQAARWSTAFRLRDWTWGTGCCRFAASVMPVAVRLKRRRLKPVLQRPTVWRPHLHYAMVRPAAGHRQPDYGQRYDRRISGLSSVADARCGRLRTD